VSRDVVARFDVNGVLFELVPTPDRNKLRGSGNARLCLKVDNMDRALEELQSKQVQTTKAQAKEGGILASFRDPDGNEICLWQYESPTSLNAAKETSD
jgi:predicted enzyme related to lactoylglutathione lyase